MKILILALSGIGDALMFTPALSLLRRENPDAQIDALVMFKGVKDIYERNPNLNNILHFDFLNEGAAASLKYVLKLRGKYDASISVYPANRREYNIINLMLGAKKRVGVNYLRKNFQNFGWLNNVSLTENDSLHNVQENIKLCGKLLDKNFTEEPKLGFYLSEEDENFAQEYLNEKKILNDEIVIGFHPGCATLKNHIKRRWEPEKFAELGKKLIDEHKTKVLIFGGPEEDELKKSIKEKIDNQNAIVVQTKNLAQSAALMKRCNVFVTNDSSLMHVASAMQRKVVAIIGPTNTNYIHPWKTEHKIVTLNLDCSPCFIYSPRPLICFRNDVKFKCIKELGVDLVYEAVKGYLT